MVYMFEPHIDGMIQDGFLNPRMTRTRVVNDVLRPINIRMRQADSDRALLSAAGRPESDGTRQRRVRDAIDYGIRHLDVFAPNEWNYLRGRLQAMREEDVPLAHDRNRLGAPYSMFRRSDLEADDPEARNDAPEALGGDRRIQNTGLGFVQAENTVRRSERLAEQRDPVIALTVPPRRDE
jgi:hypothetical protein